MNTQENLFNAGVAPIMLNIAKNHKNNPESLIKANLEAISELALYESTRNEFINNGLIDTLFDILDDYYNNEEIANKCFEILMILGNNEEGKDILLQKINLLKEINSPIYLVIYGYVYNLVQATQLSEALSDNETDNEYISE
jgi:hypothetical protein